MESIQARMENLIFYTTLIGLQRLKSANSVSDFLAGRIS